MYSEPKSIISYFLHLCTFSVLFLLPCTDGMNRQEYIVYMGHLEPNLVNFPSLLHWNFLQNALGNTTSATIIYSYKHSFNGFVALLTNDEVKLISSMEEVVSVFPNGNNELYTTNSWNFMGFPENVKRATLVESNIIIGVIDTGIWPEADSFKDTGFGPPPTKWKGSCRGLTNFTCNNKIIGARYYKIEGEFGKDDIQSPRDTNGHGTHIASIVAGNHISLASFYGLAKGTARGGVPSSRIAAYKVCWFSNGCRNHNILAAFDQAIQDGVDIISCSMGAAVPSEYFDNWADIGSFYAMRVGIMTSMAAGNEGPISGTVTNLSPWSLTVASCTTNRKFVTNLTLGDNSTFQGISVNPFDSGDPLPIVYGGNVAKKRWSICHVSRARMCLKNSLSSRLVRDKIVLCDESFDLASSEEEAMLAGAKGILVRSSDHFTNGTRPSVFRFPGAKVNSQDGNIILKYIRKTSRNATATIMRSNAVVDEFAPNVAMSSSKGPNPLLPHILKPDLCAPGVGILGAWIPTEATKSVPLDKRNLLYGIKSGTSYACPHVSAAAAYVKSFHPTWSSSALKSALMTTASEMIPKAGVQNEFSYGAGLLNPVGALNPGLVYDANERNYIEFLCSRGYDDKKLQFITGEKVSCKSKNHSAWNLNLPSFTNNVQPLRYFKINFSRTVTNVGFASTTYSAKIVAPPLLKIEVVPTKLQFSSVGQTRSFMLTVAGELNKENPEVFSYLYWTDGTHNVRSPIIIYF